MLEEAETQGDRRAAWLQDSRCEALDFGEDEDDLDLDEEQGEENIGASASSKPGHQVRIRSWTL